MILQNKKYKQIITYLFSGGTATLTNILGLYILTDLFKIWYITSAIIAFLLGCTVSFFLQKFWTFKDSNLEKVHVQASLYLVVAVFNLCLNTLIMYIFVDFFGLWYILSQIISSGLIAILSFFIYKYAVFRSGYVHDLMENVWYVVSDFFRKHYLAIIFAVIVGIVTIAPQIIFMHSLGSSYKGIYMMKGDVEEFYLARINQVYKGNVSANPFIYEYRNSVPKASFSLAEAALAGPGILFNLSVPILELVYKLILPAIVALLIYALFFKMSESRPWSIALMCAVMFGYNLLNFPDIVHLLKLDMVYTGFSAYSRPIYPQFSEIFYFLYLNLLYNALKNKAWRWYIYMGLIFGISFYIYMFTWSFIFALNGVIFIYFLLRKDRQGLYRIFISSCIGFAIGSWFIMNMIRVASHPYFADFAGNEKMIFTHMPIVSVAWCITVLIFLAYFIWNRKRQKIQGSITDHFIFMLLVTALIVINQQVITGRLLQEGHYHWYFNVPIFFIALMYAAMNFFKSGFLKNYRKLAMTIVVVIILVSLSDTILVEYSSYSYWHDKVAEDQRYSTLLDWLNSHTTPDDVILANENISVLVPVYTFDNVVWEYMAVNYLLPKERLDFTPENILTKDFAKNIKKFRVDYVLYDTLKDKPFDYDQYRVLKFLGEKGGVKIYKVS